jgi:hypothetical protein
MLAVSSSEASQFLQSKRPKPLAFPL